MSALFFGLAAITVDVSRWYLAQRQAQNAADAAALAGVTYMPQDLTAATSRARDIASDNGYATASDVAVARGLLPSQLQVTVSTTVNNIFGKFLGVPTIRISRSAVADYTGPQPMGSPCNTFGNEPPGFGSGDAGPVASQLQVPSGASCPRTPDFWYTIHGPEVYKTQGDQYMPRVCGAGESDCDGTTNKEFKPEGYFLLVRVLPAAVGTSLSLQLYDPAYVSTSSNCTNSAIPTGSNYNPWTNSTDAPLRYAKNYNPVTVGGQTVRFCTGDDPNSGNRRGNAVATVTSYALRAPTDDFVPIHGAAVTGCTRQWPGYNSVSAGNLTRGNGSYNADLARVFHQWVPLCSFTPTKAGDYYLQVRTNVAMQGAINDACATTASPAACTGSFRPANAATSTVITQDGDDDSVVGNGSNRFAARVVGAPSGSVSVSAYGRMPIFANSDSTSTVFNLIRVLPGAAGKSILFNFFDIGDASGGSGATMTVLKPTESSISLTNCTGTGKATVSMPTCSLSGIKSSSGWNGQSESIVVPIPSSYTCNYNSPGGCWFRVQVSFGGGSAVTDATTWTASVIGDPVRLIQ